MYEEFVKTVIIDNGKFMPEYDGMNGWEWTYRRLLMFEFDDLDDEDFDDSDDEM